MFEGSAVLELVSRAFLDPPRIFQLRFVCRMCPCPPYLELLIAHQPNTYKTPSQTQNKKKYCIVAPTQVAKE